MSASGLSNPSTCRSLGIARQEDIEIINKRLDGLENRVSHGFSELKEYLKELENVVRKTHACQRGQSISFQNESAHFRDTFNASVEAGMSFTKNANNLFTGQVTTVTNVAGQVNVIDNQTASILSGGPGAAELKEYLIALENSIKGIQVKTYCAGMSGWNTAQVSQPPMAKSVTDLFKNGPATPNDSKYKLLEARMAELEAEMAFLKNLPPALMETLGYKKN